MALKSKPLGFSHQGIREPLIIWYKKIQHQEHKVLSFTYFNHTVTTFFFTIYLLFLKNKLLIQPFLVTDMMEMWKNVLRVIKLPPKIEVEVNIFKKSRWIVKEFNFQYTW